MSKYIDADKLKEMVNRQFSYCHGYTGTKKDIYREALLAVKSAIHCQSILKDMQKVVRCKDCKHYVTNTELLGNVCNRLFTVFPMKPDDYCSYGERKDEE